VRPARLLLLAVVALLVFAPAAGAEVLNPFTAGTGAHPDVAVDSSGIGHVVWDESVPGADDPLHYCQVPAGGSACAIQITLHPPEEAVGRSSYVFAPSPSTVYVVSFRCCGHPQEGNWLFTSTDGGHTFDSGTNIGDVDFEYGAQLGPGNTVSGAAKATFQNMPVSGPGPADMASLDPGFLVLYAGFGVFNNSTPVLVQSDGDHLVFWRYSGSRNMNAASSWVGPTALDKPGADLSGAGGGQGMAFVYVGGPSGGPHMILARKFDGANFGPATQISESGDTIFPAIGAESAGGRFDAVWIDNSAQPNEIRFASSTDGGGTWSPLRRLLAGAEGDDAFNFAVSGANGSGFVAWDQNSNTGQVRVLPFTPTSGLSTGGGNPNQPVATVTVGNEVVQFFAPTACVPSGQPVNLRVTSKAKKAIAGNKGRSKILQVLFKLDKKQKTDKKAAFKASFPTKGFKKGSNHKIAAKVDLRQILSPHKRFTKTLRASVSICP
jgi:hypothetical protein